MLTRLPYVFCVWHAHVSFSLLLIATLVTQSTAFAQSYRKPAENESSIALRLTAGKVELGTEKDNDTIFYPLADDEEKNESLHEKTNLRYPVNGKSKEHNLHVLVNAIRQILAQLGFSVSELREALSANESLFQNDSKNFTNKPAEIVRISGWRSMPEYEKRMTAILRRRNTNEDKIKLKIQELLRGNSQNRTLLIKMIQLVAKKWGQDVSRLPEPFGDLNYTGPINYPAEFREELRGLAPLLTKDLQHDLQRVLAKDLRRTRKFIQEVATLEEDNDGNRIVRISRHATGSSKHSKPKIKVFSEGKLLKPVFKTNNEEGVKVKYNILKNTIPHTKKEKTNNEPDISPAHLESVIRREQQQRKARMFLDVTSVDIKHRNRMTRANASKPNSRKKRL
ncbi:unnamed protein product [Allacma fusca]|uniref:Uncharacterized protein n=1 Tax=Allacma fusca TaxID=39272 RepID=A0A8J2L5D3_9HEXA|nr:unnamed protein product [Allacma fusca]